MTYAPFDDPDAPPLSDDDLGDFGRYEGKPGSPSPDAVAVGIGLNRVAKAIDRLAVALSAAPAIPPGGVHPPPHPPIAGGPPGGPSNETQVKRGKKIYAICKQNEWDIPDIGQRVTGHTVDPNSQKWSEADQVAVLDAFKQWGVG